MAATGLFLLMVALLAVLANLAIKQGKEAVHEAHLKPVTPPKSKRPRSTLHVSEGGVDYDYSDHPLFLTIEPAIAKGDWDGARFFLQKIAYGIKSTSEEEQREFRHIMTGFASQDPMIVQCMDAIAPILAMHPQGVLQTSLYAHMASAPDAENARYVLYFADELGRIVRKKKGNTYLVFAPGAPTPAPSPPQQQPEISAPDGIAKRNNVHVRKKTPAGNRYAELNRQATQVKAHSYDDAVALLYEAKAIKGDYYDETRLAKFLQHAGRLDDALAEIQWLVDRVPVRLAQWQFDSAVHKQRLRANMLAGIYDAAILICERAEREDLCIEYTARRDAYASLSDKLDALAADA